MADKTLIQSVGIFVGLLAWDADPSAFAANPPSAPQPAPVVAAAPAAAPAFTQLAGEGEILVQAVSPAP